jgi:isopentenyl-diphosphate delta-isomerase
MNYYDTTQFIAQVNKAGEILGQVEKWEAHKKSILHRAFSVIIEYKGLYLLQHRKHPVFDGVFDLSCSSHPTYKGTKLEEDEIAVLKTLKREWGMTNKDIKGRVQNIGVIYYKAIDPKSRYTEHELCEQFLVTVKTLPKPNADFAYGYSLVTKEELQKKSSRLYENLAPWAKKTVTLL